MQLSAYIDNFSKIKPLVVGDIMLDIFMYGSVERISPEAPVPVFKFGRSEEMLGGAGNVAVNLASLGCETTFVGIVGQDIEGTKVSNLLTEKKCKSFLLPIQGYSTTVKTRMIASHNHLLRLDREQMIPDLAPIFPALREKLSEAVSQADIVLLSDYAKGLFNFDTTPLLIKLCQQQGKPVIVDPKGRDYSKYAGATLIKPNLKEFQETTGMIFDPKSDTFHQEVCIGAKKLFSRYHVENLLVTLSEFGMIYISSQSPDEAIQIPTQAKEVYDVSGAGDTAFAALSAALGVGANIRDAIQIANYASGIVVGKLGTSSVTPKELQESLVQKNDIKRDRSPERKIVNQTEIVKILAPLKKQNKTIGFTNGCFDCMHLGHLNSFSQAAKECDVLVVGVNSDASIRRYKGPNRPVQDQFTRATLVASLEYVDYVIIFDDDTAEPLVQLVHPDVIAKEGYTLDKWPEAQMVVAYGGRPVFLKRLEGYSTSTLIAKIKE